jgi:hypothetical protein
MEASKWPSKDEGKVVKLTEREQYLQKVFDRASDLLAAGEVVMFNIEDQYGTFEEWRVMVRKEFKKRGQIVTTTARPNCCGDYNLYVRLKDVIFG